MIKQFTHHLASSISRCSVAYNDEVTPELPRRVRGLPTSPWSAGTGLTPRSGVGANGVTLYSVASRAVPLACHSQRS
jgi:hypothetical protein